MTNKDARKKAVWGPKRILVAALALAVLATPGTSDAAARKRQSDKKNVQTYRLDKELQKRAGLKNGTTRVIIELKPGYDAAGDVKRAGGRLGRKLGVINAQVADVPNSLLRWLEKHPGVAKVSHDRPAKLDNYRTAVTTGAMAARLELGVSGSGVGVAVIDSGITSWSNDLMGQGAYSYQRVSQFVDFVNGQALPYDDNGHGTHVAGIVAGNGYNSLGLKAGMAPRASIVALKVLDQNGTGTISNIIAALDWVVVNKDAYNIRVANLSLGAGVYESYWTDPLTLAAKRAVDAGVVVVASAGNLGKNAKGYTQYGGITAPGNAPWVLTVGASSTMGTLTRVDDTMAGYSSRGPTYLDYSAKPDLVAPGTGTVSLSDPTSLFYTTKAQYLVDGSLSIGYKPYLSLSGTSMAAPVVAGSVALMLQANPALTPNAVKAILQYTSQIYPKYDFLTQGAGFLNTSGAVKLALFLATARPGQTYPTRSVWAKHIIWGNHRLRGGYITLAGTAWGRNVTWGDARTQGGGDIVWGNDCDTPGCDNIVWGNDTNCGPDGICGNEDDNIVWGNDTNCGPDGICGNDDDNIVWGNAGEDDNIVWGNDCQGADCDNIVWGNVDDDNIVWGNAAGDDNIVWGNSGPDGIWGTTDDMMWGSDAGCGPDGICGNEDDNIVWGNTDCGPDGICGNEDDNIVWGNTDCGADGICGNEDDNIVWGNAVAVDTMFSVVIDSSDGTPAFDSLFGVALEPETTILAPIDDPMWSLGYLARDIYIYSDRYIYSESTTTDTTTNTTSTTDGSTTTSTVVTTTSTTSGGSL